MPTSPEEVETMIAQLVDSDVFSSPYQVAYLFFIALLRHSDTDGDMMNEQRQATTMRLFEKTLHPGCFMEDPKDRTSQKIRKHTRASINRVVGNPAMARCYFQGATPINNYKVDYANLTVKFQGGLGYKREEGKSSDVAVYCEGQQPRDGVPQTRNVNLEFFENKWWVKVVTKILISPMDEFWHEGCGWDHDADEIERENEYRKVKGLPLIPTEEAPVKKAAPRALPSIRSPAIEAAQ
jgi:hypothetical protein